MGDRLLTAIIALEKALQEEVCQEAARAVAWRERELAALARELAIARQGIEVRQAEETAAARRAAEAEGERACAAVAARCARLAALPDRFLEGLLRARLGMILPEAGDDHPDGEG